jgi:hypothetical protein
MMLRPPVLAIALGFLAAHAPGPTRAALAGPADSGYRLAGVIETGGDGSVAIIEVPSGGQVLIHEGSAIDGGTVTELSRRGVRIVFPDHIVQLTLSGQPRAALQSVAAAARAPRRVATRSRPPPPGGVQEIVSRPLTRNLSRTVTRDFIVNGVAGAPSNTDAKRYVDAEIALALDLPSDSRVVAVNDQTASSPDQIVSQLQQALINGSAIVTIDTPQGEQRVYLLPAPPTSH